jgi:hypothetical protein
MPCTIAGRAIHMNTLPDIDFPVPFQLLEHGVVKTGSASSFSMFNRSRRKFLVYRSYWLLLVGQPSSAGQIEFLSISVYQFEPISSSETAVLQGWLTTAGRYYWPSGFGQSYQS